MKTTVFEDNAKQEVDDSGTDKEQGEKDTNKEKGSGKEKDASKKQKKRGTTSKKPDASGENRKAGEGKVDASHDQSTDQGSGDDTDLIIVNTQNKDKPNWWTFRTSSSGIYVVRITATSQEKISGGAFNLTCEWLAYMGEISFIALFPCFCVNCS